MSKKAMSLRKSNKRGSTIQTANST